MKKISLVGVWIGICLMMSWLLLVEVCSKHNHRPKELQSFYYWQTNLNFNKKDAALADSLNVGHLYVRYFDVDWSCVLNEPVPVGSINTNQYQTTKPITPVVFITNRTFEKLKAEDCSLLANRILKKVQKISSNIGYEVSNTVEMEENQTWEVIDQKRQSLNKSWSQSILSEIQIDCDWTKTTKERYFQFLLEFKKILPAETKLSATIRLYQYKYAEESGVPPVDKGLLMCYNMDNIKDIKTQNSIFDYKVASQYFTNKKYPLSLDVALPIFSWGILFHGGIYKGLVSNMDENSVKNNPTLKLSSGNRYTFTKDTVIGDTYIREGDLLRLEQPDKAQISKLISLINKHIDTKNAKIAFFHWETTLIRNYEKEISTYYGSFN